MTVDAFGHPDFLSYAQWIGFNLAPGPTMNYPPGPTVLYSGETPAFASLHIRISPNAGFGRLVITWFLDQAQTLQAGMDAFRCSTAFSMLLLYPAQAPFVSIVMNNDAAVNMTGQSYITPSNAQAVSRRSRANPQLMQGFSVTVPASTSTNFIVGWLSPGHGQVQIIPGDAAGKIHYFVQTVNADQSFESTLLDLGLPVAPVNGTFTAGLEPVRLQLQNTDAAAPHSVTFALIIGD